MNLQFSNTPQSMVSGSRQTIEVTFDSDVPVFVEFWSSGGYIPVRTGFFTSSASCELYALHVPPGSVIKITARVNFDAVTEAKASIEVTAGDVLTDVVP
jgi:hypothetical protein